MCVCNIVMGAGCHPGETLTPDGPRGTGEEPSSKRRVYGRGGLEFERPAFFTDAVFAIAMTLLIVSIAVPTLRRRAEHERARRPAPGPVPAVLAFFIGFAVLGNYWIAMHRFYGRLERVNERFIIILVFYLAFVAWLPFPTALLGEYADNPISVVLFAVSASAVSSLEAMLLWRAYTEGCSAARCRVRCSCTRCVRR